MLENPIVWKDGAENNNRKIWLIEKGIEWAYFSDVWKPKGAAKGNREEAKGRVQKKENRIPGN